MRRIYVNLILVLGLSFLMTSCFTYTATVGSGPQSGVEVKKKNHYLIYGLAPVSLSNSTEMVGGAENYEITITHTFIDGLLNAITFGIYSPTTTIIKK